MESLNSKALEILFGISANLLQSYFFAESIQKIYRDEIL